MGRTACTEPQCLNKVALYLFLWLHWSLPNRKFAGSIPDDVTEIFHWHNPSGRTMALGLTKPLTEMSTRIFPGGKGGRCVGLTLPHSCADCLEIWEPQPPGTLRACRGLQWDCFTFTFISLCLAGCQWRTLTAANTYLKQEKNQCQKQST